MMSLLKPVLLVLFTLFASPAQAAPAPEKHLLESYLVIQKALAADSLDGVAAATKHVVHGLAALRKRDAKGYDRAIAASKTLLAAKVLPTTRDAFKEFSASMIALSDAGLLGKHALIVIHCPMADASWLQEGTAVANPYYGKSMLRCGTPRSAVPSR